jgi:PAS domain S-box-containing protein
MTSTGLAQSSRSDSDAEGPTLFELLKSFPGQARLALGRRGVLLATLAGLVGLVSCAVAFADIALSLHRSDVDPERHKARDVLALDASSRVLLRNILANSAANPGPARVRVSGQPWREFTEALALLCREFEMPPQSRLAQTCAKPSDFIERLGAELVHFDDTRIPIAPALLRELLALRDDISDLSQVTTRTADAMVGRLVDDYTAALLVLTLSTTGFAAAGLMLILLVGRASMTYHRQWRRAAESVHEAEASRDMLREIIDTLPAGVTVYDKSERLLMFNTVALSITPDLSAPDSIGKTYEELARQSARRLEAMGRGPQPVEGWIERFRTRSVERMRQAEDGRWFNWFEIGTPSGYTVGLRIDVTDVKQHELALEHAHTEYQTLVDSLADVAYRLDVATGKFTFMSAAAKEVFGVPPEQMVGRHFLEFIAPDSYERVRRTTTRPYNPDDPGTFARFTMIGSAGAQHHVEVRARRRIDAQGRVISIGVIRDVEEHVRLEARLDQEVDRLRSIVESGGALIVLVDAASTVVMVNSGFTQFTGIAAAEAVERPLQDVMACPLNPARTRQSRFTLKLTDREGRERLVAVTATPTLDSAGAVSSIVLLGVDNTERREAEQALYDAERFATVGEMAATMAHEISQPLQVINIACATAREELGEAGQRAGADGPAMEFVRGKLERIAQQVDAASRIIGDLRAYVRGTSSGTPEPFDVNTAVRSAIDLTDHGLSEAGMKLGQGLDDGVPRVMGDGARLEQVVVNLINNARDAGGNTVTVATDTAAHADGRRYVRISVEDNGPGIRADILPRLFHFFVSTKPRGKGTGLGLRICRRIIEEMGGTISAANRPEGGARFEILLPAIAS